MRLWTRGPRTAAITTTTTASSGLLLLIGVVAISTLLLSSLPKTAGESLSPSRYQFLLNSTLCDGHCVEECISYLTPLNQQCYNGQALFPNDSSWGDFDIQDTAAWDNADPQNFERRFYATKDGSCQGVATDFYVLPLHECLGPFGKPRPWGSFSFAEFDGTDKHGGYIAKMSL